MLTEYIDSLKKIISNIISNNSIITFKDYLFASIGTFLLLCSIIAMITIVYFLVIIPKHIYCKYIKIYVIEIKKLPLSDERQNYLKHKIKRNKLIFAILLILIYIPIILPLILILLSIIPNMILNVIGIVILICIAVIIFMYVYVASDDNLII